MAIYNDPQVTLYARVIDNITKEEINGFQEINQKSKFNFGTINGISGGESPVIIEFDIWNNEPAFAVGFTSHKISDAIECQFTAWDSSDCNSSANLAPTIDKDPKRTPFIHARCVSRDNQSPFVPIAGARTLPPSMMFNSLNNNNGTLSGDPGGDHIKIQTKIVIPRHTTAGLNNFVFEFSYNYL